MTADLIENIVRAVETHLGSPTFTYRGGVWSCTVHGDGSVAIWTGDSLSDVALQVLCAARVVAGETVAA